MKLVRRNWLIAVARQFQVAALDFATVRDPARLMGLVGDLPSPQSELERLILDGLLWRCHRAARLSMRPKTTTPVRNHLPIKVKEYLEDNYSAHVTYAALAHHFGKNPQYIETTFKTTYGISIRNYLTSLRLRAASTHIANGEKVESAALSVGWTKSTYFRALKKKQSRSES